MQLGHQGVIRISMQDEENVFQSMTIRQHVYLVNKREFRKTFNQ